MQGEEGFGLLYGVEQECSGDLKPLLWGYICVSYSVLGQEWFYYIVINAGDSTGHVKG